MKHLERTDEQLIAAYFKCDERVLNELVHRNLQMVYNFVHRFAGNTGDAEDITQEVFVKVRSHLKSFHSGANFKTWLFTIAHRTAIDWLRKRIVFSDMNSKDDDVFSETIADTELLPGELFAWADGKAFVESSCRGSNNFLYPFLMNKMNSRLMC